MFDYQMRLKEQVMVSIRKCVSLPRKWMKVKVQHKSVPDNHNISIDFLVRYKGNCLNSQQKDRDDI